MASEVAWQQISQLFPLGQQVEKMIRDDLAQQNLFMCYRLDDQLMARAIGIYRAQLENFADFYEPQLERWQGEDLSLGQRQHLHRVSARLTILKELVEEIVTMLPETKVLS